MINNLSAGIVIDGKKYDAFDVDCETVKVDITESGDGYLYRRMVVSNPSDKNSPQITSPRIIDTVIDDTRLFSEGKNYLALRLYQSSHPMKINCGVRG